MSYIVEKKVGDTVYLYEATSYWDSQKKQSRQTRTYLGKKDPISGKVIPPHRSTLPRRAKDYGNVYLLRQIATRIGLTALLQRVFGEDAAMILALACFEICDAAPLYLFPQWIDSTYMERVKALSSAELTTLTQRLGGMEGEREEFFRQWIAQCSPVQTIVFDITSLSSYSNLLNEVEWATIVIMTTYRKSILAWSMLSTNSSPCIIRSIPAVFVMSPPYPIWFNT
jgi:hypothetical protein